jgi:hypothetical protein
MPVAATAPVQFGNATIAKTVDLDSNFLQTASGAYLWGGVAAGTANALVINGILPLTDYFIGMSVRFLASATNAGACTLGYDALAPYPLVDIAGTALTASAIVSGNVYEAQMVQTVSNVIQWRLLGGGGAGGAVSSVFGRVGAITAMAGDYSIGQISGANTMATQDSANVAITGGTLTNVNLVSGGAPTFQGVTVKPNLAGTDYLGMAANPVAAGSIGSLLYKMPVQLVVGGVTITGASIPIYKV